VALAFRRAHLSIRTGPPAENLEAVIKTARNLRAVLRMEHLVQTC
jgi:hypothetical protein